MLISRIPEFYKLTPQQRLEKVAQSISFTEEERRVFTDRGLTVEQANQMIENVIGFMQIPLGVAVNFRVNGKDVFIPMATEEPSVVAAASNAAKLTYNHGGFNTSYTGSVMRGQIQLIHVEQPYYTMTKIYEKKDEIIQFCNQQDKTLVSLGGGATDLEVDVIEEGKMLVVYLFVDTKDAMGANSVNTMLEKVTPVIEDITKENVGLRIISNLADRRIVRARATFENPFNEVETCKFLSAYELAMIDPYRAVTHNKGIMNGISAIALATGNDTRAIEAGAHAYATKSGHYRSLTHWEIDRNNRIVGTIALPLSVGIVGGATQSNSVAKMSLKMMNITSSEQLAGIMASVGLAQNFAALRALVVDGIQKGHMKLHARNLAIMAGAREEQVDIVVQKAKESGIISYDTIREFVISIQQNGL